MGKIIGIDLGTTNSVMSYMSGGKATVIPNAEGDNLTPSVVAIDDKGGELVGRSAKNQAVINPEGTIYSVKRLIGRRWDDKALEQDKKHLPFKMRGAKNKGIEFKFGDKWVTPQEVSAKVLAKMKKDAEAFLGEGIDDAVITVPAYFDDSQRKATKDAGKIAGFNVKRVINEPTAAALAYGLEKKADEIIAVYDLGGGTFDVSVLEIGDGVFEVLSTNGDTHLGGDDWDQLLVEDLVKEFKNDQGIDLREDSSALQRLKEAAEKAKIELSAKESTEINLPYITADDKGPKHLQRTLTRADLEKLSSDLIERTVEPCKKALKDAKMKASDIDEVILVGGMTRMPAIRAKVKEVFEKDGNQTVNPDEAVSVGAAIQAGVLGGDVHDITLLDVTPLSLGVETKGGIMDIVISRNTTIPVEKKKVYTTAVANQTSVEVHVLQGEREMAGDNKTLGRFMLDGIPPAPAMVPKVEVSFAIDANGILNVKAVDQASNKEQHITITASTGLNDEEVDKMVEDAAKHAEEDKKKKERAETKNNAETLCFSTEKLLKDSPDKIDAKEKEKAEKLAKELKDLVAKDDFDLEKVKEKSEELTQVVQGISKEMYEKAAQEAEKETAAENAKKGSKSKDKDKDKGKDKDKKEGKKKGDPGKGGKAQEGEVVQ